ncbi:SulP family inorganic anion transporter [Alterisphingorhabdus coralli]|uniref:SulP family inorganic anion transporter n=1 Tax=Alterisphingorhabdus coralli TaxID=3071408 RepID=A0AA97F5F7_9SPHN|nr:SulP family inorganic anion transporter [Parasphingorhabdus sp. SCSIO 66989]WOE74649.1 SulP family inorganic anion transporter [Parasphingorhabdus sp. SCSIO 66989]
MAIHRNFRRDWLSNPRTEFLAGLVVALALIPEAIGFSIIAGVDPRVGLYASFSIAVIIALVGGRPGMISAATAAVAVLVGPLVREHGVDYLFAATVLMGVFQGIAGLLRLDLLMRFVSRSVITGFVNALAILIFMAQLPQLTGEAFTIPTYAMVAAGLIMIYGLPYVTRAVPAPLVAIIAIAAVAIYFQIDVITVGEVGKLPDSLPSFYLPDVPLTFETLQIIAPYSLAMAAVGLLESLLTASIVDDMTETRSDKRMECYGQGVANFVTGFLGGMGGCAMIGQSVVNITSGGRRRLSTFVAGVMLLVLIVALGNWVALIPMPALVAVMIFVSISTFRWRSFLEIRQHPLPSNIVMLATVGVVVWTHDLSMGVLTGVLLSGIFFAYKVRQLVRIEDEVDGRTHSYRFGGEIFFGSVDLLYEAMEFNEDDIDTVIIDVHEAHFWDISASGMLEKIVGRLQKEGKQVQIIGLNQASATLVEKFSEHDRPFESLGVIGH